jgi:hypothetical protein
MNTEMTAPPRTTGYLLLFRGTDWENSGLSLEEIRQVRDKVNAWFDSLLATGKMVSAQPLLDEGVVLAGKRGVVRTDGPFAEAKEVIGGYVLLSVDTMEEAVELAKGNPMFPLGLTTEIRPTATSCPHLHRIFNGPAQAVV